MWPRRHGHLFRHQKFSGLNLFNIAPMLILPLLCHWSNILVKSSSGMLQVLYMFVELKFKIRFHEICRFPGYGSS
jgi:hypothetical protein